LEPHHTRRLADGGPDAPDAVAALCPTCHRRVHHAKDGGTYNEQIAMYVAQLER
jgi:5-methylcytosine-specific restriction protein A